MDGQRIGNEPFLTTRQMILLHYVAGLADRYLATPSGQRGAFLASSVDPLALGEIASGYSEEPRYVETFVVEAMVSNPDAALSDDSITDLVALANDAFGLLE